MEITRTTQVERNCLTKICFFVVEANKDFYITLINLLIYWFHNRKNHGTQLPPPHTCQYGYYKKWTLFLVNAGKVKCYPDISSL